MQQFLSIYFSEDRTYIACMEPRDKGLFLNYIEATRHTIDFQNLEDDSSKFAAQELEAVLADIDSSSITRLSVTLPADSALISHFPGDPDMKREDIQKLLELELKQAYPQLNFSDFTANVYHLSPSLDGQKMMMAVIINKKDFKNSKKLLKILNLPVSNLDISQMNAHSAYLYNYPERHKQTTALIGVQNNFLDVSIIKNGIPVNYDLVSMNDINQIGDICQQEFDKMLNTHVENIDAAYFFGSGLTKEIYMKVWETSMLIGFESGRLNAFRMMSTELDSRKRDYCSRVAHIYPACVGGCLPSYHEKIIFK